MAISGRGGSIRVGNAVALSSPSVFTPWTTGLVCTVGLVVKSDTSYYVCKTAHTAGATFDTTEQANFDAWVGIAGEAVGDMSSWKIDININTIDIPVFGNDGWKNALAGMQDWSGSIDGFWNVSDNASQQKLIQDAGIAGTSVDMTFDLNGKNYYKGDAIIKGISIDAPSDNVIKLSVSLQGNGKLTFV